MHSPTHHQPEREGALQLLDAVQQVLGVQQVVPVAWRQSGRATSTRIWYS